MAADVNRVVLVGRLTRDPELRRSAAGEPVANVRLAFTNRARDGAGAWTDRANYIDVTLFGQRAELAQRHLTRGRRVGIDGRLSWNEWHTKDGDRRQTISVVATELFFLDSRPEDGPERTPRAEN